MSVDELTNAVQEDLDELSSAVQQESPVKVDIKPEIGSHHASGQVIQLNLENLKRSSLLEAQDNRDFDGWISPRERSASLAADRQKTLDQSLDEKDDISAEDSPEFDQSSESVQDDEIPRQTLKLVSDEEKNEVCDWWKEYQQKKQNSALPELEQSSELDQIITETNQWWKNRAESTENLQKQDTMQIQVEHSIEIEQKEIAPIQANEAMWKELFKMLEEQARDTEKQLKTLENDYKIKVQQTEDGLLSEPNCLMTLLTVVAVFSTFTIVSQMYFQDYKWDLGKFKYEANKLGQKSQEFVENQVLSLKNVVKENIREMEKCIW